MSAFQPASLLATEKPVACGSRTRRAGPATHRFQRSTALSSSRPFLADAGSGPWQLCGNGRNGWSTKLIRGLVTEAATGFQSRRGRCREPTPVTPHYAPFPTYKAAGCARQSRGGLSVAARGKCDGWVILGACAGSAKAL